MSIWTSGPGDGNRLGRQNVSEGPDKVPIPDKLTIVQIAIGWKHGHFFTDKNDFYSWGYGSSWRLGTGNRANLPTPQKINTFPPNTKFKQVACGDKFSAVTTQSGQLIVWGSGYAHTPTALELPAPAEFIACGQIFLLAALSDGSVMQFYRHLPPVPQRFGDERIISVACGANHKLALAESGKVYSWGTSPATGQGGVELPRVIASLSDVPMCAIYAYHNSSFFVDTQYRVWCCGTNSSAQLGLGHVEDVTVPIPQEFNFNKEQIVQIACGDDFTLYLTVSGNVWASGNGGDNRNATGSSETRKRPVLASKLAGKYITQVAAGCFNSAFLENGCPPFNHMMQFRGYFADYPVSQIPFRITMLDRINVEVDPTPEALKKFGFMPNDIIIFSNSEKAKVIGVANDHVTVMREEKNQICILHEEEMMDIIANHPLISRDGADLITMKCDKGFEIAVDCHPSMTLTLGGFLKGDIVEDNGQQFKVVGVRIGYVWMIPINSENDNELILSSHQAENLHIVKREGKIVKQYETMKGKHFVVEVTNDFDDLVFSENYGIGFFTGTIGPKFCYTFVCALDKILILDEKLPFVRRQSSDDKAEYTTINIEPIAIKTSCASTSKFGFYRFDRVKYFDNENKKYIYGTVLGVNEDKIGVRIDRQMVGNGYIEMMDPSKLSLVARINMDGFININELKLNVNSNKFIHTRFLPGDRIEHNGKRGVILGIDESSGEVYSLFDDDKEKAVLVPEDAVRITSFLVADAKQKYCNEKVNIEVNIALMHCALLRMKPGDAVKTIKKREATYLGYDDNAMLWFKYKDNNEIEIIKLSDINPDSFIIDEF